MKTREELITKDVIEVCEQIDAGLITVTEAVMLLLDYDCNLVTISPKEYTLSCHSDCIVSMNMSVEEFELAPMPDHYVVNL